ncbi:hypothetical protein PGT21_009337 [Puccinia graminis f. sp. tritici]|uniref:Uncharacterized protein n=1 Tax=Puccinia graminis f. sp. tritici TaxID=56615 RepID=A0A5B0ME68_PUCGR|nr:hypothetical protein PGT21_009337 [Puccinia graminis f. sp. tritici]
MRLRLCCAARYRPAAKPKPVRAEKSARPGRRGIAYCRSMDAGELGAMPCRTPTIKCISQTRHLQRDSMSDRHAASSANLQKTNVNFDSSEDLVGNGSRQAFP